VGCGSARPQRKVRIGAKQHKVLSKNIMHEALSANVTNMCQAPLAQSYTRALQFSDPESNRFAKRENKTKGHSHP
jgi:hypothetical protein